MKPFTFILSLLLPVFLFGQTENTPYILVDITMTDKNRMEQPAEGVEVKSPKATDVFTDEYGECRLYFPTKNIGDLIDLSIGDVDGNNQTIKLVNVTSLKEVAILNNPEDHELSLIVCQPKDYAECRNRFFPYLTPIVDELEEEVNETKREKETGVHTPEEMFDLEQKEKRQEESLISKKELVEQLPTILNNNSEKGGASTSVGTPRFVKGRDGKIDYSVLLDGEDMTGSYNKAVNKKIELENEINRIITKHKGRAFAYQRDSMFGKSAENYVNVCEILEENNFESKILVGAYRDAALAYYDAAEYTKSGVFYQKAIYTILSDPKANKIALANLYHGLANTYKANKNYEWATNSYKDGADIIAGRFGESSHDLLFPYHGIALCYKSLNNVEKAEEYYLKSIAIINNDQHASVSDVLNTFNNAINFYKNIGQMDKAVKLFDQSISKITDQVGNNNPMLIRLLTDMSNMLRANGEYELAMKKIDHALDIIEVKNGKESQQYKNTESLKNKVVVDRANDYLEQGRFNEAVLDFNTLILNSGEGTYYFQRGICFYYLEKYKRAQEDFREAKNKNISTNNTDYYLWIGLTYAKTNNRKEAEKSLSNYKNTNPENGNDDMAWAAYFSIRNKKEDAAKYFKRAMEKKFDNIGWINKEKGFDNIRQEEFFKNHMNRMTAGKE